MEVFNAKTKILSGSGALKDVDNMGFSRILVVADPFFAQNGTARRIGKNAVVEIFDQVVPDPTVTLAARGAALVQEFRPEAIVALGGGSAMDCAKAMAYFSGLEPKLIAVPTTSGSGSEVTDFAILTHDGVKHPLVDEKLRPHAAILDSDLVQALPKGLVAEGGFDLLSHALEAVAATGAGKISDALAMVAFCTGFSLLPRSYAGDGAVRADIHQAATMAGLAFSSAGLGLCHGLSHALGGEFHVAHGRLNAILLPHVLEFNAPAAKAAYAALARRTGISTGADAMAVRSLKNALIRLRRSLELPESLSQAGISREKLHEKADTLVAATLQDPCCATNPVPVTAEAVRSLLWEVAGA